MTITLGGGSILIAYIMQSFEKLFIHFLLCFMYRLSVLVPHITLSVLVCNRFFGQFLVMMGWGMFRLPKVTCGI